MFTEGDKIRAVIGGSILTIILIAFGIYSIATYRKAAHLTVTETNWQLEVGLMQYQPVNEDSWDHAPEGAYNIREEWEYRRSERYISGYDEDGDPEYSSRSIYDYKYYYTIDRWVNIPPLVTKGNSKETVAWPNIQGYVYDAPDLIGNVRLGQLNSHFWIVGKADNGKIYSIDMVETTWRRYYKGRKCKLTLGFFGNVIQVE
jgi:hypothetical protein